MGYIHVHLPHKNLCLRIKTSSNDNKDNTPVHRVKNHPEIARLDMKTIPANLIRMIVADYFNISHYHTMLFNESGHYVNDIETLSHDNSSYLNFTYKDLSYHTGVGKEKETHIFEMTDNNDEMISFYDIFGDGTDEPKSIPGQFDYLNMSDDDDDVKGAVVNRDYVPSIGSFLKTRQDIASRSSLAEGKLIKLSAGNSDDNVYSAEMAYIDGLSTGGMIKNKKKIDNINNVSTKKKTSICMKNGKLEFDSTRVVPQIHSSYFKSNALLTVLPLTDDHIESLPMCSGSHSFIGLENFKTFINEVSFFNKDKSGIIAKQMESMKTFLPNYIKHVGQSSPHEDKITNTLENVEMTWLYNLSSTSVYNETAFIKILKKLDMVSNMFIWSRVISEESPRIAIVETKTQIIKSHLDAAKRKLPDTRNYISGICFTINKTTDHVIVYIMPERVKIVMGILPPVSVGRNKRNDADVVEIIEEILEELVNVIPNSPEGLPFKGWWREFHSTRRVDKMSFKSNVHITMIFNQNNMKGIMKNIFNFIRGNNLGYDIKYNHTSTSDHGYKFTVPIFHMTKKQIRYYFPPNGQRNFNKILDERDDNNIIDKMPKKSMFINVYNNYMSMHTDWTGQPNLIIARRYLAVIYDHLLNLHTKSGDIINLEGMRSEISQLTKIDPLLFSPHGAKGVWSTHCQKSRQPIELNDDMVDLLTEKVAKNYKIERRVNETTGEKSYIACGPRYQFINKIVGIHPLGIPIYCCTSRGHTKGSAGYLIQQLCDKNKTVSLIDVAKIREKTEKSIQFSHMLDASKIKMPGKKYHLPPATVCTYFNRDRIFAAIGLMSPFFHRQSYIFGTLMTYTGMQIDEIIDKFRTYFKSMSKEGIKIFKMSLELYIDSSDSIVMETFETYIKAYMNCDNEAMSVDKIILINEVLHIFTYNVFGIIILTINNIKIHNFTTQMLGIVKRIANEEETCPVLFVGLSNDDGGCYTIFISWHTANAISYDFFEYVNWTALYSSILSSGQCSAIIDMINLLSKIKYQTLGIYILGSMHTYGLRVKTKNGNVGFLPTGLRYDSSSLKKITTLPPHSEKITITEFLEIKKCLDLGEIEHLYDDAGVFNGVKIDNIYPIQPTNRLPNSLKNVYSIPRPLKAKDNNDEKNGKLATSKYVKRIRLKNEILALIQNNAKVSQETSKGRQSTTRNEELRDKIKKTFYDGRISAELTRLVDNQQDVRRITKIADNGSFIDIFGSSRFIFDCEFVKDYYTMMTLDDRIAKIKKIITGPGGFKSVPKISADQAVRDISEIDLHYWAVSYAHAFTHPSFAERLYYTVNNNLASLFTLSDYVTILDQSIKHR